MIPIIIPLAADPTGQYIELKYTLRAIAKFYRDEKDKLVVLVGPEHPEWIRNVLFVAHEDAHVHKDANMIEKILAGISKLESLQYKGRFIKFSDDAILLGPYSSHETAKYFCPMDSTLSRLPEGLWKERFARTAFYLKRKGVANPLNFDTHTPQPYYTETFKDVMREVDYTEDIGYCINSLYLNLEGTPSGVGGNYEQITIDPKCRSRLTVIKVPVSSMQEVRQAVHNCRFMETDQLAFTGGSLEKYLVKHFFPGKSIFEKGD